MSRAATVGIVLLFGTGCASEHVPLQAMLLPPVDGKLALWINQPAYFAVLGVGPERGTEVLYQQSALEGVPASGYVYVPMRSEAVPAPELADPDADYEQVYLVASDQPIDLSALPAASRDINPDARADFHAQSMRYVLASSQVVDGYEMGDTLTRVICVGDQPLSYRVFIQDPFDLSRRTDARVMSCPRHLQRSASVSHMAPTRTFFTPMPKLHQPGKGFPKAPPIIAVDRTLHYLAAKDEWHALTHNGEPGTELARAGYVQTASGWSRGGTSVGYATRASTSYRSESPPARAASTASSSPSSSSTSARSH